MCPWHTDTSNGHLYINSEYGKYICFSCGAKGSLDRSGFKLPAISTSHVRDRLMAVKEPKSETKFYPDEWLTQFDFVPTDYWSVVRGYDAATIARFRLGYDFTTDRATLPQWDVYGRLLGVTYRSFDKYGPKYLHPDGFKVGHHLYGAWLVTNQTQVALVEGQPDSITGWSARIPALGLMRSDITQHQVKLLQHMGIRSVVLMLDNDEAGIKGTIRTYESLRNSGIRVRAGWYRPYWNAKDPDELRKPDRLRKMYHSAVSIYEWADRICE